MTRTMRQQIAEAAQADALFSGLTLSSSEVQQLHGEIVQLEKLVKAVGYFKANDVDGRNWYTVRDEMMA